MRASVSCQLPWLVMLVSVSIAAGFKLLPWAIMVVQECCSVVEL